MKWNGMRTNAECAEVKSETKRKVVLKVPLSEININLRYGGVI